MKFYTIPMKSTARNEVTVSANNSKEALNLIHQPGFDHRWEVDTERLNNRRDLEFYINQMNRIYSKPSGPENLELGE